MQYLLSTYPLDYTVTATTGRAAVIVGGQTVDSLFQFSRDTWTVRSSDRQVERMENCADKIIVDEASMVGVNMARILYGAAVAFGKTLILVGDWAQASPVKEIWPFQSTLFEEAKIINLRENHRQEEGHFYDMLNRIRVGDNSPDIAYYFQTRIVPTYDDKTAVRLTGIKTYAREYNIRELRKHALENNHVEWVQDCDVKDTRPSFLREKYPTDDKKRKQLIDNASLAHELPLALDCRALLTWNSEAYVNGDTGDVEDFLFSPPKDVDGIFKKDSDGEPLPARRYSELNDADRKSVV